VLPRPACPCLIAAQLPSPALSRTLLLTPGPPSCSGPRVSRPHRVAHARPLPCLHGNAVAHTRRPGAVAGRPALPTTAPGPLFPRPPSPCGRARRAPPPLFPSLPHATKPLEKPSAAAPSFFSAPFPSRPHPGTRFLLHLPLDPVEQLEHREPPPHHRNWP
jgi:hypothetical protein